MTVPPGFMERDVRPRTGTSPAARVVGLDPDGSGNHQRMFKRHKVLPHPRKDDPVRPGVWRQGLGLGLGLGHGAVSSQNGGSPGSKVSSRLPATRGGRGPEPPPTPPAHSRTSSASQPVEVPSPSNLSRIARDANNVGSQPPATPPSQQTPPTPNLTPDQTPPGPAAGEVLRRPPISDRNPSKLTTGSTTDSFRTARENPYSSEEDGDDDDDGRSTLRPVLSSAKTSQSTVRQVSEVSARSDRPPVGLGLGFESPVRGDEMMMTETAAVDKAGEKWANGKAGAGAGEREGGWDPHLMRNVTIRKRRPTRPRESQNQEVIDDLTVAPTNATQALRSVSLQESPVLYSSRRVVSDRGLLSRTAPSTSESSSSVELKRSSVMSTKSNASTVVEAILVETAPQRRRTLRHVRKQSALRDSSSELSPPSSAPTSVSSAPDEARLRHETPAAKASGAAARDSQISTATSDSLASRKARRSVWKTGGVPVVVIPERRSSIKSSSKSPSLRSTSSRRSQSLSSVPVSAPSRSGEHVPHFERPVRRSRALSESDGSRPGDERTMDFPPVIPARSSSLSAPTSRNASRAGSLTAESLRAHNMLQTQRAHHALQEASRELDKFYSSRALPPDGADRSGGREGAEGWPGSEHSQPAVVVEPAPKDEQHHVREVSGRSIRERDANDKREEHGGPGVDGDGDPFLGTRLSVQNTPFSVASVETAGTSHAEVSEAMAVNIYPHQSKSVVLVNHTAKPSESSSLEHSKNPAPEARELKTADTTGGVPGTPPQQFSVDDIDSPLRNPRAPPKPPVINFIPATPSGLTPAAEKEKQLGNYYEMTTEKPKRSLSLLRRALTRRNAEYGPSPARPVGLLTRTFSLSRNVRSRPGDWDDDGMPRLKRRSTVDDAPADETRLHPFWRPACAEDESSEDGDEYEEDDLGERTYRYPAIDNRPSLRLERRGPPPRRSRSLSSRLKRTFAILPLRHGESDRDDNDDDDGWEYPVSGHDGALDRRTIRRTPSGNLRVMKFRRSMESLTGGGGRSAFASEQQQQQGQRQAEYLEKELSGPFSSATGRRYTRLWRSLSLKARLGGGRGSFRTSAVATPNHDPDFLGLSRRATSAAAGTSVGVGAGTKEGPIAITTRAEPSIGPWKSQPSNGSDHSHAHGNGQSSTHGKGDNDVNDYGHGYSNVNSHGFNGSSLNNNGVGINDRENNNDVANTGPSSLFFSAPAAAAARLGDRINIARRLSERRREARSRALRGMISAPREVRDGVGDVVRRRTAGMGATGTTEGAQGAGAGSRLRAGESPFPAATPAHAAPSPSVHGHAPVHGHDPTPVHTRAPVHAPPSAPPSAPASALGHAHARDPAPATLRYRRTTDRGGDVGAGAGAYRPADADAAYVREQQEEARRRRQREAYRQMGQQRI